MIVLQNTHDDGKTWTDIREYGVDYSIASVRDVPDYLRELFARVDPEDTVSVDEDDYGDFHVSYAKTAGVEVYRVKGYTPAVDNHDDREDFDMGHWTDDDERSMNAGPDMPLRNDAGEYMCG